MRQCQRKAEFSIKWKGEKRKLKIAFIKHRLCVCCFTYFVSLVTTELDITVATLQQRKRGTSVSNEQLAVPHVHSSLPLPKKTHPCVRCGQRCPIRQGNWQSDTQFRGFWLSPSTVTCGCEPAWGGSRSRSRSRGGVWHTRKTLKTEPLSWLTLEPAYLWICCEITNFLMITASLRVVSESILIEEFNFSEVICSKWQSKYLNQHGSDSKWLFLRNHIVAWTLINVFSHDMIKCNGELERILPHHT